MVSGDQASTHMMTTITTMVTVMAMITKRATVTPAARGALLEPFWGEAMAAEEEGRYRACKMTCILRHVT